MTGHRISSATTKLDDFVGNGYWITGGPVGMCVVVSPNRDKVVSTGKCGHDRVKAPKR